MQRFPENPLIRPEDVPPSRDGMQVVGTFNAGAFRLGGRVGLLVRVAERPVQEDRDTVVVPAFDTAHYPPGVERVRLRRDDPAWDFSDRRVVLARPGGPAPHHYLTSISHLRLAWSDDGRRFSLDGLETAIWPDHPRGRFGLEDPRVTEIDGLYHITCSAVGDGGICVVLLTTTDFRVLARHGAILPPENKDVCLFPARQGGDYVILHRPSGAWCKPGIWIAHSPDLVHWGAHRFLAGPRPGRWDGDRIGAGPPPIRTPRGWLVIYHGSGPQGYCLGAILLDIEDPGRVLARSDQPLAAPRADYERDGFFSDVIFCNGLAETGDGELWLYYGAADRVTAGGRLSVRDVLDTLA